MQIIKWKHIEFSGPYTILPVYFLFNLITYSRKKKVSKTVLERSPTAKKLEKCGVGDYRLVKETNFSKLPL